MAVESNTRTDIFFVSLETLVLKIKMTRRSSKTKPMFN